MSQGSQSVALIGIMGVGKSSIGKALATRMGLPLFDTDEIVSARLGLPVSEIFAAFGEATFRDCESNVLRELPSDTGIIATGGGIVLREENVKILCDRGKVIWLDADQETLLWRICQGAVRPALQGDDPRATLAKLIHVREPLYRGAADVRLDTSRLKPDEVVEAILAWITSS